MIGKHYRVEKMGHVIKSRTRTSWSTWSCSRDLTISDLFSLGAIFWLVRSNLICFATSYIVEYYRQKRPWNRWEIMNMKHCTNWSKISFAPFSAGLKRWWCLKCNIIMTNIYRKVHRWSNVPNIRYNYENYIWDVVSPTARHLLRVLDGFNWPAILQNIFLTCRKFNFTSI